MQLFWATSRVLIAFSTLLVGASAGAQSPRTNLGVLTCTLGEQGEAQGPTVGEGRAMRCVFKSTVEGVEQTFSGVIRKVAQGQIPSGKLVMIWVVQGPEGSKQDPAMLEQTYFAAPESGGAGLVGERNPQIVLHAEAADSGPAGVSVTVMQLKLLAVPA